MGAKWIAGVSIAGMLALLPGCSSNRNESAQTLNPELRSLAQRPEPPAAMERHIPVRDEPVASNLKIHGPRSQEEINRVYAQYGRATPAAGPQVGSIPAPMTQELPPDTGPVVGDAAWDVPISREWRHIVVHHSASTTGSAAIFDRAHRERGWDGLGYHFVIGNGSASGDGEVETGYRWNQQKVGAHAGNAEYNQHGIGICLVGDFQHGGKPSARQMASLRRLVRFLQVKTAIPTSEIIGHKNVPGRSTECPGEYMNLEAFRASLGGGAIGVPVQIVHSAPPRSVHRTAAEGAAALP